MLSGDNRASRNLFWLSLLCLILAGCAGTPTPDRIGSDAASSAPSNRLRVALKQYYHQWAGVPYLYGGETRRGIDCSAFVQQAVAATRSLSLPRTTLRQSQRGYRIPARQLRVGDLVFFRTGGGRHVGIYIGSNRFIHASSSAGVTISSLNNIYWRRHFWQARRLR